MRILYLHGTSGGPRSEKVFAMESVEGVKPIPLLEFPPLRNNQRWWQIVGSVLHVFGRGFGQMTSLAQKEFDKLQPDLVVGSSLGCAIALRMDTRDAQLVLISPLWKSKSARTFLKHRCRKCGRTVSWSLSWAATLIMFLAVWQLRAIRRVGPARSSSIAPKIR